MLSSPNLIVNAQLVKASTCLLVDMFLNPTTPWWRLLKLVAVLQAKMMSSRGSVAPLLNRASRRKGAAIKADVNLRVCVVASWTAPAVALVAAVVALEVATVIAVAVVEDHVVGGAGCVS